MKLLSMLVLTSLSTSVLAETKVLTKGLDRPESAYVLGDTLYISNQ